MIALEVVKAQVVEAQTPVLKVVSSNPSRSDISEMPCSWNDFFISVRKLPIIELMDLNLL